MKTAANRQREYLYKKGYRRFAFVGDTSTAEYGIHPISLRLNGFRKELITTRVQICPIAKF